MRATFRAVEVLYNAGLEPRIVRLPEGNDPDKYVRNNGAGALKQLIDDAVSYIDFVDQSLPDKFVRLPISRQEKVIGSLAQTAAGLDDDLKHELFVRKVIETFSLPPAASTKFERPKVKKQMPQPEEAIGRAKFENAFLGFLMAHPNFINECLKVIQPEHFGDPAHTEIYRKLKEWNFEESSIGDFLEKFPDEVVRLKLTEIIVRESAGAPPETRFNEFIDWFRNYNIDDRLRALQSEIAQAEKDGQTQKADQLTKAMRDLLNSAKRKAG
jgi:DNA primase